MIATAPVDKITQITVNLLTLREGLIRISGQVEGCHEEAGHAERELNEAIGGDRPPFSVSDCQDELRWATARLSVTLETQAHLRNQIADSERWIDWERSCER